MWRVSWILSCNEETAVKMQWVTPNKQEKYQTLLNKEVVKIEEEEEKEVIVVRVNVSVEYVACLLLGLMVLTRIVISKCNLAKERRKNRDV